VRGWLGSIAVFLAMGASEDAGKTLSLWCRRSTLGWGGSYHVKLWRGGWRLLQRAVPLYVYIQCMGGMDGLELIGRATFY
jgi:hypothetical protein